jgi:hypothetical protein
MSRKSKQVPTTAEATTAEATTAQPIEQGTPEQVEQGTIEAPATPKAKAEPKPLPTLDEALATAKAESPDRYAHVVRVVSQTKDGRPARVVITCSDPQTKQGTNGEQVSVCEGEREIATQDLFQVRCCAACADRIVRRARRNRTKARIRALRDAAKASKAEQVA